MSFNFVTFKKTVDFIKNNKKNYSKVLNHRNDKHSFIGLSELFIFGLEPNNTIPEHCYVSPEVVMQYYGIDEYQYNYLNYIAFKGETVTLLDIDSIIDKLELVYNTVLKQKFSDDFEINVIFLSNNNYIYYINDYVRNNDIYTFYNKIDVIHKLIDTMYCPFIIKEIIKYNSIKYLPYLIQNGIYDDGDIISFLNGSTILRDTTINNLLKYKKQLSSTIIKKIYESYKDISIFDCQLLKLKNFPKELYNNIFKEYYNIFLNDTPHDHNVVSVLCTFASGSDNYMLYKLAELNNNDINIVLMQNPNTPIEIIYSIYNSKNFIDFKAMLKNQELPFDIILDMLNNNYVTIEDFKLHKIHLYLQEYFKNLKLINW